MELLNSFLLGKVTHVVAVSDWSLDTDLYWADKVRALSVASRL
jgi:hypothetical protein